MFVLFEARSSRPGFSIRFEWSHRLPVRSIPGSTKFRQRAKASAALTATSSPPARAFAYFSGTATLLETMTSCANDGLSATLTVQ